MISPKTLVKLMEEYTVNGRIISLCPKCNENMLTTEGYVNGNRGSVTIRCKKCGEIAHVDGSAEINRNADPRTIIDRTEEKAAS